MAEFHPVLRTWISGRDDARIACRLSTTGSGGVTLAELLEHLSDVASDVPDHLVTLHFATVAWEDSPTDDERRAREESRRRHHERHLAWEREKYEQLRAKFENDQ